MYMFVYKCMRLILIIILNRYEHFHLHIINDYLCILISFEQIGPFELINSYVSNFMQENLPILSKKFLYVQIPYKQTCNLTINSYTFQFHANKEVHLNPLLSCEQTDLIIYMQSGKPI